MSELISLRIARSGLFAGEGRAATQRWERIVTRARDFRPAAPRVREIMRRGPGSVLEQLQLQMSHEGATRTPFVRTKPFGRRPMPLRTLFMSGRYRNALMGEGEGVVDISEPKRIGLSLDADVFPQWPVFQRRDGPTVVKAIPSHRYTSGRFSGRLWMQVFLGLNFGLWFSERFLLEKGFRNPARRVSTNLVMRERVARALLQYLWESRSTAPARSKPGTRHFLSDDLRKRVA